MSNSLIPVEAVKVLEPVMNVNVATKNSGMKYVVRNGTASTNWMQQAFQSNDIGNLTANVLTNSTDCILDRRMYIQYRLHVVITGNSVGVGNKLVQIGTNDGPRQFPLMNVTDTIKVIINGNSVSQNINDYLGVLTRTHEFDDENVKIASMTPSMPASYLNFSDWALWGSAKNSLSLYGENAFFQPNNSITPVIVNANNDVLYDVVYEFCDPLFISPFMYGTYENGPGMVGVNTLQLVLNTSNQARVWCHGSSGNPLLSVTASLYDIPNLLLAQYTPSPEYPIHDLYSYPFVDYDNQTNSVRLDSIPDYIVIYVSARKSDWAYNNTYGETFLRIDNLSVKLNNQPTQVSGFATQQLYAISLKNGLKMTYTDFRQFIGSVIILRPGYDLILSPDLAPGVNEQSTLQVTLTMTNLYNEAITSQINVLSMYSGTFSLSRTKAWQQLGNLTRRDVITATNPSPVEMLELQKEEEQMGEGIKRGSKKRVARYSSKLGNKKLSKCIASLDKLGALKPLSKIKSKSKTRTKSKSKSKSKPKRKTTKSKSGRGYASSGGELEYTYGEDFDGGDFDGGRIITRSQMKRLMR